MTGAAHRGQLERLLHKVAPQGRLLRSWALPGGLSAQMTALEVQLPGGQARTLVVRRPNARALRRSPHAAADEFRTLRTLAAAGVDAPAAVFLDESGEIFAEPALVLEYVEGRPDYAPADVQSCVTQMAAQLAAIHRVDAAHHDLTFLPDRAAAVAAALETSPAQLDDTLDEGRIREVLAAAWPWAQRNAPALLHGDFWPGNLLWRDGRLVAVVDWEDAQVGDPLADLAVSRLDILWIYGADAMHTFTQHYQALAARDDADLPYWDLCAALRPAGRLHEWAAGWPELGRGDITVAMMAAGHRAFVAQALAQLGL